MIRMPRVDNGDENLVTINSINIIMTKTVRKTNLVTGVPTGSPSITVSCSLSVKRGISSLTSSRTMKMVASLASC